MISLSKFNLNDKTEWGIYLDISKRYTLEVCAEDEDLEETMDYISSEDFHKQILMVSNRDNDKFHVCRILKDNIFIGFCDYICYVDENGKCIIGNFFLYPEHRNKGYGTEVYSLIEKELVKLGGKYIDITPAEKAITFYLRKGFSKTDDKSLENCEIAYRKML